MRPIESPDKRTVYRKKLSPKVGEYVLKRMGSIGMEL